MEELSLADIIGHIVTVVATVVGVYYAGVVGFKKALEMNELTADRSAYYLMNSLYRELRFNVENMENYINKTKEYQNIFMESTITKFREELSGMRLNTFLYNTAQESDATFECDARLLNELSKYYFLVEGALEEYHASEKKSPTNLMVVVESATDTIIKEDTLQRMSVYCTSLSDALKSKGVDLSVTE